MSASPGKGVRSAAYARAGVDTEQADRAVDLLKEWVAKTRRPEVVGGIGGFAGLFDASALKAYDRPLLATSTDGVGTKVAVAQALGVYDTIGFDLVGMVVDDVVACGAEPLFMTDYIACGKVVPDRIASIVKGISEACVVAGCAVLGGEIAEHPGLLEPDEFDVAGAVTAVVEAADVLGPERVRPGDVVIAMGSSGLHSNGYSLVRRVFADAGIPYGKKLAETGRTLGEELLEPTRVYAQDCLALARRLEVHAFAHVTGGGIAANVARVAPPTTEITLDRSTWTPQPIFDLVGAVGGIGQEDLEAALNMGIGMVAVLGADLADRAVEVLMERGVPAWIAGEVLPAAAAEGTARLAGTYRHQ